MTMWTEAFRAMVTYCHHDAATLCPGCCCARAFASLELFSSLYSLPDFPVPDAIQETVLGCTGALRYGEEGGTVLQTNVDRCFGSEGVECVSRGTCDAIKASNTTSFAALRTVHWTCFVLFSDVSAPGARDAYDHDASSSLLPKISRSLLVGYTLPETFQSFVCSQTLHCSFSAFQLRTQYNATDSQLNTVLSASVKETACWRGSL